MRVCYVAWRAVGDDGWARYTVEAARGVRALGVEPVLVTADSAVDPGLGEVEHHALLAPPFGRRFATPRGLLRAPGLRRVAATCDLVHCTVELYAPLVALARPRGTPYVQTAHGTWAIRPLESWRQRPLFAPAFRRADLLLFQSRFTRDLMARRLRLPRHAVEPGGVHPADFERASPGRLPDWADRGRVVLSVGALKERKGHAVALEAVALARAVHPDLRHVVIGAASGSAIEAERLQARAVALGMADRFHWIEHVAFDELVSWYRRAAVFLLLPVNRGSSFEGLGLVYLEAGAAGTPSIGTRGCGAADAIVEGETGFLVTQGDARAAADALLRLLGDEALRDRMGRAARERACTWSWAALARRLVTRYRGLLDDGGGAPEGSPP